MKSKSCPVMLTGAYELDTDDAEETIIGRYCSTEEMLVGCFCTRSQAARVKLDEWKVPDGSYENLIDGKKVSVKNGVLAVGGEPVIFLACQ